MCTTSFPFLVRVFSVFVIRDSFTNSICELNSLFDVDICIAYIYIVYVIYLASRFVSYVSFLCPLGFSCGWYIRAALVSRTHSYLLAQKSPSSELKENLCGDVENMRQ